MQAGMQDVYKQGCKDVYKQGCKEVFQEVFQEEVLTVGHRCAILYTVRERKEQMQ